MKTFEKGGIPLMKEKKEYRNPMLDFYPAVSEEDVLTSSPVPTLGSNETPLIFY